MFRSIISAEQLQVLLQADTRAIVFDTRFKLDDALYGQQVYDREHIPGAYYLHLDRDLSSPISPTSGRHPLPDIEQFATSMQRFGVCSESQVIAYDDAGGMFAARLWWLLKWLGHDRVAVLDGGWPSWLKLDGAKTSDVSPARDLGNFAAAPRADMLFSADEVRFGLEEKSLVLCDARAPERYRGDVEPIDTVAGHVPGAINVPFMQNLRDDKCFKDAAILRAQHAPQASNSSVHMCGSGVTACHNILAYAVAGLPLPKLYAGSWSEWIRDPSRPVAIGDAR